MASPVSHPGCFLLVFCLLAVAVLSFPLQSCSVIDFGAKGDNQTEDTTAIQKALNSCQTVTFPAPGKYLTRSLSISQSNQDIVLQSGATLVSWSVSSLLPSVVYLDMELCLPLQDPNTYNLTSSVRALLWYSSMSSANVTLTGGGTIDGQGWRWWPFMKTRPRPSLLSMDHGLGVLVSAPSTLTAKNMAGWSDSLTRLSCICAD